MLSDCGTDLSRESDGATVRVILDRPWSEASGISGETITAAIPGTTSVATGDVLWLGTERFSVVTIRGDVDRNWSAVSLESLGHQVDTYALDGALRVVYIDESDPNYPAIGAPGNHDPEWTYVSSGPNGMHAMVFVGPLQPAVVPAGARIDWAALYVVGDIAYGGPTITLHRVLRPAALDGVCWSRYMTGRNWSLAGCADPGVDFDEAELGLRLGLIGGTTRIGAATQYALDLAAQLDAGKAFTVPFVLRATGANATARFYSESSGDNRPFLRVRYTVLKP